MLTTLLTRIEAYQATLEAFVVFILLSLLTYCAAAFLHVHGWVGTFALFGGVVILAAMVQALLLPIDDQPSGT